VGPLDCATFHANRCTGVGTRPQNRKFPLFGKDSPRSGEPFDRFLQILYAPSTSFYKFDVIRFTGYGVIAEKPRVSHLLRIFRSTL